MPNAPDTLADRPVALQAEVPKTAEEAMLAVKQRYDQYSPALARSHESLGYFLGSIHEEIPIFGSDAARTKLVKRVRAVPTVAASRTYKTDGKSPGELLLAMTLGIGPDVNSLRTGYYQALQAGRDQARSASAFSKWLAEEGGVSGARRRFQEMKKNGAFGPLEKPVPDTAPAEAAVVSLARSLSLQLQEVLPPAFGDDADIPEGYFVLLGVNARDADDALRVKTIGVWKDSGVVEAVAQALQEELAAQLGRPKRQAKRARRWKGRGGRLQTPARTLEEFFPEGESGAPGQDGLAEPSSIANRHSTAEGSPVPDLGQEEGEALLSAVEPVVFAAAENEVFIPLEEVEEQTEEAADA